MSATQSYSVTGMTCGHCVKAVKEEIALLPGVTEVTVDLVPRGSSTVLVTSDGPLAREQVMAAVDEAGYVLAPTPE